MSSIYWDQIKDLEKRPEQLRSLGIDEMVSVTTNDLENLRQKARDEGIETPVLADPDLAVSEAYAANQYGMMGTSADGHSFIVVGPDGKIRHRADYGGAPNCTMYVPVETRGRHPHRPGPIGRRVGVEVVVLTQQACAFCEQAKTILGRLAEEYPISIRLVDLNSPEGERMALAAGIMFPPGILIDGEPFSYGRPSERKLRRALQSR